jgi:hypothetical protein
MNEKEELLNEKEELNDIICNMRMENNECKTEMNKYKEYSSQLLSRVQTHIASLRNL